MNKYTVTFGAVCSVEIEAEHRDEVIDRFNDLDWDSGDVDIHTIQGVDVDE